MPVKWRGQTGIEKCCERLTAGAHFICCKLTITQKKPGKICEIEYVQCCAQAVVADEIALHLDKRLGRGRWMYKGL